MASLSSDFFDAHEVRHRRDHPADLGTVLLDDRVVDALEAQRTQRLALVLLAAEPAPDAAFAGPQAHPRLGRPGGPSRDPRDGRDGAAPRARRRSLRKDSP